ncbi:MAG TPA: tripartite tricarboxylate transporter substrate binding protein [Burkholderiales bacterium]|nr:tripartite tricarboxylate transporter substrate binding protein [Burkholderiales bacterium]
MQKLKLIRKQASIAVAAAFLFAGTAHVAAQPYPTKPVRVIIPFVAGGPADFIARLVGPKLSEAWGQPIIVDNRGGGSQIIATELAAKAQPDGHTLLLTSGGFAVNVSLYPKLPYDSLRDFTAVSLIATGPNIVVVHPAVPARSLAELITYARSKAGQLVYASAGSGAPSHLAVELFKTMARIDMVHVPYKGMAPGITDLLGGQVQLAFPTISAGITHARAGRLRALAVTTAKRSHAAPEIPTIAEAALPGFEASNWYGVITQAKTPPQIVRKIHDDIARALTMPDIRDRMLNQGLDPVSMTPEEFTAYIKAEIVKWAKVVRASGAKAE